MIINYISNSTGSLKIDEISRETRIGEKSLKNWLEIIYTIRTQCPDFSYSKQEDKLNINSAIEVDRDAVRILSKKYREKPELKEFFEEFDSVLSKTKRNITFAESQINTNDVPNPVQRQFDPRLNDLQLELSQVLQKGLSYLSSPETEESSEDSSSNLQEDLLLDLKRAVKLGINGLEHIERVDHKIKKNKLIGWRAELVEAFKERERRISSES